MPADHVQRRSLVALFIAAALLPAMLGTAPAAAAPVTDRPCVNGMAAQFPCQNIDLKAYVPLADLGGGRLSDVWGWRDPVTNREYALVGSTRGLLFVDVTNPSQPRYLGNLPKGEEVAIWQDVEVYKDHAFVVCDLSPCGMQVFDLTRLRGVQAPQPWVPNLVYPVTMTTHTIDINPETGFAYLNGAYLSQGSHIVNVSNPIAPVPAGFIRDDGYTHDTLCRIYRGPDTRFAGKEICFAFNEDTITVYDLTSKTSPVQLGRVTYSGASYVHSGALTTDHRYLISTDETDNKNTIFIWDVTAIDKPKLIGTYTGASRAIDHNPFMVGSHLYLANYKAGLRILDTANVSQGVLTEIAYFDVAPPPDTGYDGAWSVYPYLPSGNVLISGMGQGLFVVDPTV